MKMYSRLSPLMMLLLAVSISLAGTKSVFAFDAVFVRNLSVGTSGEDVRQLQIILNSDPTTRIQGSGPGSPGQETAYFGALTRDAVTRFQEKYSQEILVPNGLSAGTGFVGPSTLAMLTARVPTTPVSTANQSPTQPASVSVAPVSSNPSNPNLKNLDKFLAAVERVATKQSIPPAALAAIKDVIAKEAATTTDLRKKFLDLANRNALKNPPAASASSSAFDGVLATIKTAFKRVFMPQEAEAIGATPFGGALLFSLECTCSYMWEIMVEPLPPSYAVLLTYTPFSQMYLNYNIPDTQWLLGKYSSGAPCMMYAGYTCISLPSEGMITPMVGSSGF